MSAQQQGRRVATSSTCVSSCPVAPELPSTAGPSTYVQLAPSSMFPQALPAMTVGLSATNRMCLSTFWEPSTTRKNEHVQTRSSARERQSPQFRAALQRVGLQHDPQRISNTS